MIDSDTGIAGHHKMSSVSLGLIERMHFGLPPVRYWALAVCMLLYGAAAPFSSLHLDLGRDARVALAILDGSHFPLTGPLLAGHVRLGPIWYYLLATLLWISDRSWLVAIAILFGLAALQFPMAYLLGKALHSRRAGLMWCVLLLLPSWSSYELVFPTHTLLTTLTVLATVLLITRYLSGRKVKYLFGASLMLGLALHAHPTTIVLVLPMLVGLTLGIRSTPVGAARTRLVTGSVLAVMLPFAPVLVDQYVNGISFPGGVFGYAKDQSLAFDVFRYANLVWQAHSGGLRHWLQAEWQWAPVPVSLGLGFVTACHALGALQCFRLFRTKGIFLWAVLGLVFGTLLLYLIRNQYPYYMTTTTHVLMLGITSVGLASLNRANKPVMLGAMALGAGLSLTFLHHLQVSSAHGGRDFSFLPLFNVTAKTAPARWWSFTASNSVDNTADWLCSQRSMVAHGSLAANLLHSHMLEQHLRCSGARIQIGGDSPASAHWVGLPKPFLRPFGEKGLQAVGAYWMAPAEPVLSKALPTNVLAQSLASTRRDSNPQPVRIEAEMRAGERLAISHLGALLISPPVVKVETPYGQASPEYQDWVVSIYSCQACGKSPWRVVLNIDDPYLLDVVKF